MIVDQRPEHLWDNRQPHKALRARMLRHCRALERVSAERSRGSGRTYGV